MVTNLDGLKFLTDATGRRAEWPGLNQEIIIYVGDVIVGTMVHMLYDMIEDQWRKNSFF